MTRILLSALVISAASSCSANQNHETLQESKNYEFKIYEGDLEIESTCPKFEAIDRQTNTIISSFEACSILLEGFREFDARRDFAFIELSEFKIEKNNISYIADMEIIKGPQIRAKCKTTFTQTRGFHNFRCMKY